MVVAEETADKWSTALRLLRCFNSKDTWSPNMCNLPPFTDPEMTSGDDRFLCGDMLRSTKLLLLLRSRKLSVSSPFDG